MPKVLLIAAVLNCSSPHLSDIVLSNFKADDKRSVQDSFLYQLSKLPCKLSVKYFKIVNESKLHIGFVRPISAFVNLQELSLDCIIEEQEDVLFLVNRLHSIYGVSLMVEKGIELLHLLHLLSSCRVNALALSLCPGDTDFNITHATLPAIVLETVVNDLTKVLYLSDISSPRLLASILAWTYTHLHTLRIDCETMTREHLYQIQAGCPILKSLEVKIKNKPQLSETVLVLDHFPQGWLRLKSLEIVGQMKFTVEGVLSVASCSQSRLEKIKLCIPFCSSSELKSAAKASGRNRVLR